MTNKFTLPRPAARRRLSGHFRAGAYAVQATASLAAAWRRGAAAPRRAAAALTLASVLSACAAPRLPETLPELPPAPPPPAPAAAVQMADETAPLLAYHQQLRRMTQGELLQELVALGQRQPSPRITLQSAMVLQWTRGAGDLARAQALYDSVAGSAHPLAPLAALLSAQCYEQRRLAEHGERLAAQLRDSQRKNEQLADMLESLKAIERNLPARAAIQPQGGNNER
jgi:hypothetical protein